MKVNHKLLRAFGYYPKEQESLKAKAIILVRSLAHISVNNTIHLEHVMSALEASTGHNIINSRFIMGCGGDIKKYDDERRYYFYVDAGYNINKPFTEQYPEFYEFLIKELED